MLPLVLHAILIMVQATTLNVAFNSHNKSLLTIMMSNNVSITHRPVTPFRNVCSSLSLVLMFLSVCSLLRSKGAFSRSLKKTTFSRCQIVVSGQKGFVQFLLLSLQMLMDNRHLCECGNWRTK